MSISQRLPIAGLLAAAVAACSPEPRSRLADTAGAQVDSSLLELPADSTPRSDVEAAMAPVWQAAADSGYSFRAVGQEPGWLLTIHPTRGIRYLGQYGEERLEAPPVEPVSDGRGTLTWLATTPQGTLAITFEAKPCADGMSGERMTHTVTVRVGGGEVRGCGRALRPR